MSDINPLQVMFGFLERFSEVHRNYICNMILAMDARGETDIKAIFSSEVDYWTLLQERFGPGNNLPVGSRGRALALRSYLTAEFDRLLSDRHAGLVRAIFSDEDAPGSDIDRKAHLERFERQREELLTNLPDWRELVATALTDAAIEHFATFEMIRQHDELRERAVINVTGMAVPTPYSLK